MKFTKNNPQILRGEVLAEIPGDSPSPSLLVKQVKGSAKLSNSSLLIFVFWKTSLFLVCLTMFETRGSQKNYKRESFEKKKLNSLPPLKKRKENDTKSFCFLFQNIKS
jgi:hypothetical protein